MFKVKLAVSVRQKPKDEPRDPTGMRPKQCHSGRQHSEIGEQTSPERLCRLRQRYIAAQFHRDKRGTRPAPLNDPIPNFLPRHGRRIHTSSDLRHFGRAIVAIAEQATGYGRYVVHQDAVEMEVVPQNLGNSIQRAFAAAVWRCVAVHIKDYGPKQDRRGNANGKNYSFHQLVERSACHQRQSIIPASSLVVQPHCAAASEERLYDRIE